LVAIPNYLADCASSDFDRDMVDLLLDNRTADIGGARRRSILIIDKTERKHH
jgi:hypothetical protein